MISRDTAQQILVSLVEWADDNDIEPEAIQDLAERLTRIKGNNSYEQSMAVVALLTKEMSS